VVLHVSRDRGEDRERERTADLSRGIENARGETGVGSINARSRGRRERRKEQAHREGADE